MLILCVFLIGCSNKPEQPAGSLKNDSGIDAAVYALQTIDYVEGYVEKPSAMHKVLDLNGFMSAAVNKIPESDMKLREDLGNLQMRVLDLDKERLLGNTTPVADVEMYHRIRDELLGKIQKIAGGKERACSDVSRGPTGSRTSA